MAINPERLVSLAALTSLALGMPRGRRHETDD